MTTPPTLTALHRNLQVMNCIEDRSPSWVVVVVMSCSSLSFLCPIRSIPSSIVSLLISLITFTVLQGKTSYSQRHFSDTAKKKKSIESTPTHLVWPTRWHRSSACLSLYGLQSMSCRMTTLAEVRLMPSPPARVDSKKMKISWSLLNWSIRTILKQHTEREDYEPSLRGQADKNKARKVSPVTHGCGSI